MIVRLSPWKMFYTKWIDKYRDTEGIRMEKPEKEIILSIVISTYNRSQLLMKNLKRMINCKTQQVEFVVGDNASEDNTWEQLQTIKDSRVHLYHNDVNYGMPNQFLLVENTRGRYFLFLNDRDYILPKDIDRLVTILEELENCDFVVKYHMGLNSGYYSGEYIPLHYFHSKHPGHIIYNAEYYKRSVDRERIVSDLKRGKDVAYLPFSILCNVKQIYILKMAWVRCNPNLGKIKQLRSDPFGNMYLAPKRQADTFFANLEESRNWKEKNRINSIIIAQYRDSLRTVTSEYFFSLQTKGFVERYNWGGHTADGWVKNGIEFIKIVLGSKRIKDRKLFFQILYYTVVTWMNEAMLIARDKKKKC